MNREGKNLEKRNSWQLTKHAMIYSGLLRPDFREILIALGSQHRGP